MENNGNDKLLIESQRTLDDLEKELKKSYLPNLGSLTAKKENLVALRTEYIAARSAFLAKFGTLIQDDNTTSWKGLREEITRTASPEDLEVLNQLEHAFEALLNAHETVREDLAEQNYYRD